MYTNMNESPSPRPPPHFLTPAASLPRKDLLKTELVMHRANHDPQAYGLVDDAGADATRKSKLLPRTELNVAQKAANWCYTNPFKMVGEITAPIIRVSSYCPASVICFAVDSCRRRETEGGNDVRSKTRSPYCACA